MRLTGVVVQRDCRQVVHNDSFDLGQLPDAFGTIEGGFPRVEERVQLSI